MIIKDLGLERKRLDENFVRKTTYRPQFVSVSHRKDERFAKVFEKGIKLRRELFPPLQERTFFYSSDTTQTKDMRGRLNNTKIDHKTDFKSGFTRTVQYLQDIFACVPPLLSTHAGGVLLIFMIMVAASRFGPGEMPSKAEIMKLESKVMNLKIEIDQISNNYNKIVIENKMLREHLYEVKDKYKESMTLIPSTLKLQYQKVLKDVYESTEHITQPFIVLRNTVSPPLKTTLDVFVMYIGTLCLFFLFKQI